MVDNMTQPTPDPKAEEYGCLLAIGTLILAQHLRNAESNKARKQKKANACKEKHRILSEAKVIREGLKLPKELVAELGSNWPSDEATKYLVDLLFVQPFFPYELKFDAKDHTEGVKQIGRKLGLPNDDLDSILKTRKDAIKAYKAVNWLKVGLLGVGGLVVIGVGGYLAAPSIAAAIGSAAGLYGAAGVSYGLAFLGGGSLAAGGFGMAGGLWLVTGAGALAGVALGSGAGIIYQMGAAGLKNELIKLEITFKEVTLKNTENTAVAQAHIQQLIRAKEELEDALDTERSLNEENSERIKTLKEKLKALERAVKRLTKLEEEAHAA